MLSRRHHDRNGESQPCYRSGQPAGRSSVSPDHVVVHRDRNSGSDLELRIRQLHSRQNCREFQLLRVRHPVRLSAAWRCQYGGASPLPRARETRSCHQRGKWLRLLSGQCNRRVAWVPQLALVSTRRRQRRRAMPERRRSGSNHRRGGRPVGHRASVPTAQPRERLEATVTEPRPEEVGSAAADLAGPGGQGDLHVRVWRASSRYLPADGRIGREARAASRFR